jgi:hypothetical protein
MRIDSQTLFQSHLFNVDGQVLISTTYWGWNGPRIHMAKKFVLAFLNVSPKLG